MSIDYCHAGTMQHFIAHFCESSRLLLVGGGGGGGDADGSPV